MSKFRNMVFWIVMIFGLSASHSFARQHLLQPEIGLPCPEFTLHNIDHFDKNKASKSDFNGKWLVLDFWTSTCGSCIAGFPKMNALQKQYGDRVQFLLVGKNDQKYNKNIRSLFERVRSVQHLNLPVAYDSLIFEHFSVTATPQILIIDPKGIVRAITYGSEFNKVSLENLLEGKASDMVMISAFNESKKSIPTIEDNELLIKAYRQSAKNRNGSVLSEWNSQNPLILKFKLYRDADSGRYQGAGLSLKRLYNMAYFGETDWKMTDTGLYGKVWREPVLALKDTTFFENDFLRQQGMFTYSLFVPVIKASKAYMQFAMQCDLKKCFGYKVIIENRMMPCWNLIASKKALDALKNKDGQKLDQPGRTGFKVKNADISNVLKKIWVYHTLTTPFFDLTGFKGTIDLDIQADMTSLEDIRNKLAEKGLNLVRGNRQMKVLVITE